MKKYEDLEGLGIDDLTEEELNGIDKRTLKKLSAGEVFLGEIGGTGPRVEKTVSERRASIKKELKEDFKAIKELSAKETVQESEFIEAFKANLKKGVFAKNLGVSTQTINDRSYKFFGKSYKSALMTYKSQERATEAFYPETVDMPSRFEDRITEVFSFRDPEYIVDAEGNYVEPTPETEEEVLRQCAEKALCPILANEVSGKRWRGFVITGTGTFHEAITSLPYYNYNPIKRLRRAGASWLRHGEFETQDGPEGYFGENDGLAYLKARLAKTPDELYLTEDGGLIISENASRAMAYNFIGKDQITSKVVTKIVPSEVKADLESVVENYPMDRRLEAGDPLTENRVFPTDGYLVQTNITGTKHFVLHFQILKRGVIRVGDKLLGLTGLKGIVAKIDPDLDSDIVVNPNQIYGTKASRKCGAAIKELRETGRLGVFFQPNQLASSRFSGGNKKATISSTTYPFIALYGSEALKSELLPSVKLADIFYMLDLVLDSEGKVKTVNRECVARPGGKIEPFGYPLWEVEHTKKNIWIPDWVPRTAEQKRAGALSIVPSLVYDAIVRISKISLGKEITDEGLRSQEKLMGTFRKEMAKLLVKSIAPIVRKGRSNFVAVPKLGESGEIEITAHDMSLLELKDGQKVIIRREPVVSRTHIQEMVVKETKDRFQSNNTIKLTPAAMHLMAGDFDGDGLILMNYTDSNFRISEKVYKESKDRLVKKVTAGAKLPSGEKVDFMKIDPEELYKTSDELVDSAREEHAKERQKRGSAGRTGGARKGASFAQDSVKFEEEEIVKYAIYLEEGLKDAAIAEFAGKDAKADRIRLWEKARGEHNPVLKILWKHFEEGKLSGKKLDEILGKKFLTNDKDGLYHLLISKIERM